MNKNLIILLIIGAVFIFVLGGGIGVFYKTQEYAPQIEKLKVLENTIKELSSKVTALIVAHGQVEKIEGRNIALNYKGDILTIKIKDEAKIYSVSKDSTGDMVCGQLSPIQKEVKFEDIKIGDKVNINLGISSDNRLEGQAIYIITY